MAEENEDVNRFNNKDDETVLKRKANTNSASPSGFDITETTKETNDCVICHSESTTTKDRLVCVNNVSQVKGGLDATQYRLRFQVVRKMKNC